MNPRQDVLLSIDVFGMLAEILGDVTGSVIDGGANVGEATAQLRTAFPKATIHAFEPVGEAFDALTSRVASLGGDTHAHRLALGSQPGDAQMRINRNLWTCSLLDASDRGHALHGDWCETVRTESVKVVRLDAWAAETGASPIEVIKLDLQGFEGPALLGAAGVLDQVKAVYSEAQIIPEYEGASTFSDIDALLRDQGFGLYQMTDLCIKGAHAEPSCCDGVWLKMDILERVRNGPTPRAVASGGLHRKVRMQEALELCVHRGWRRVALYGAGAHTHSCGEVIALSPVDIACVIDDSPDRRGSLWGLPSLGLDEAMARDIDAIVLSAERAEQSLIERCGDVIAKGLPVISLYDGGEVRVREKMQAGLERAGT